MAAITAAENIHDGERITIGIAVRGREITVEFDGADDIPAEWRKSLSQTIDIVNRLIEPDHKKIEPLWAGM